MLMMFVNVPNAFNTIAGRYCVKNFMFFYYIVYVCVWLSMMLICMYGVIEGNGLQNIL